ncbi:hypothetical protein IQ247_09785 [Plectonema cf. radiosum LEGE 06105]|uniref:Uncharacterized protein n=1 Tax=Plectonema cf. radiosum LEGE 06105 TaxID=945769 RepID=A0A8J7F1C0_9CYAN|nr:hypothetical protein [Plectonema radiosum]MBE9212972.1 hypothetical protein [Plectonema cf. radiosum LEGE 06105]
MKKFIIWAISVLLIVTNFEWFLGVVFDIYDAIVNVFSSYSTDYKMLAVGAAIIYFAIIVKRIGD